MASRKRLREILEADRAASQRIWAERRAQKIQLSAEDRAILGGLVKLKKGLAAGDITVLNEIHDWLRSEFERGRDDPVALAKALAATRRCLQIFSENWFPRFQSLLPGFDEGMERIRHLCLRLLVRRMLTTEDETEVAEIIKSLQELIDTGYWPNWEAEHQEFEDEICAELEQGRASLGTSPSAALSDGELAGSSPVPGAPSGVMAAELPASSIEANSEVRTSTSAKEAQG